MCVRVAAIKVHTRDLKLVHSPPSAAGAVLPVNVLQSGDSQEGGWHSEHLTQVPYPLSTVASEELRDGAHGLDILERKQEVLKRCFPGGLGSFVIHVIFRALLGPLGGSRLSAQLSLGSGHDLTVCEFKPRVGLQPDTGACLGFSLPLPLPHSLSK